MLKYFSGTTLFTFLSTLLLPTVAGFPEILDLYFNDDELSIETLIRFLALFVGHSFLSNCYKLPETSLYWTKLYISIIMSRFLAVPTCSPFI